MGQKGGAVSLIKRRFFLEECIVGVWEGVRVIKNSCDKIYDGSVLNGVYAE